MPDPLVSIIITSYNYARFLRQTIDSALGQSYGRVEVIVVDDGSTDASREIIRRYGDRIVPVLRDNGGEAAATNAGYAVSSGEIVLVLDSDDYLYPSAVEAVVAAFGPGVAKVQFYLDAVDGHGRPRGYRIPNIAMIDDVLPLIERYGYYPAPPTSGNAYARRALEKIMPLDEATWRRGPDGCLNALAALYGRVVSLPDSYGAYRIHGSNMYAGALDLAGLRKSLRNELDREAEIARHCAALGRSVPGPLSLTIPAHCKARLVSLKLDPARHPLPGDTAGALIRAGLRSAWRFPHLSPLKRLVATAAFPLLAAAPPRVLAGTLELLFRDSERGSLWRRLAAAAAVSLGGSRRIATASLRRLRQSARRRGSDPATAR
jgi:hypothetical protein